MSDTELDLLCKELAITSDATHVALVTKGPDGKRAEWPCDEWRVTIRYQDKAHVTPFKCGVGHRKMRPGVTCDRGSFYANDGRESATRDAVVAAERGWTKPLPPSTADVLSCLAREADACERSFAEWCSDLGENEDSRKALDTYLACQKTGDALRRLFGGEVLAKLAAAEH